MMIPEFGRNFTLTWIVELRGMRSQTNCRSTAKLAPTPDCNRASPRNEPCDRADFPVFLPRRQGTLPYFRSANRLRSWKKGRSINRNRIVAAA